MFLIAFKFGKNENNMKRNPTKTKSNGIIRFKKNPIPNKTNVMKVVSNEVNISHRTDRIFQKPNL